MNSALFSLSTGVKSLVEELWDYFVENYLNASAAYPNLGMQNNPLISLPAILAGLLFGTMIAVCFATYDNFTVGSFVRKMLERGALGKENAVTLYNLSISEHSTVGRALRKSVSLRRIVRCVEEEEFYEMQAALGAEHDAKREEDKSLPEFKAKSFTFGEGAHFYIPEEKRISAEIKYASRAVKFWAFPLVLLACIAVFLLLLVTLPNLLRLLDSLVGSFKST